MLHGAARDLPEPELERRLRDADAAVVMKLGRNLPKVGARWRAAGRLDRAIYVERGSTRAAVTMRLADKPDDDAPISPSCWCRAGRSARERPARRHRARARR